MVRLPSGLSHFSDPVSPPIKGPWWYTLAPGTEAPPGLQWVYTWDETYNTFHIGLEPIGSPGSMSMEEYLQLVHSLAGSYQKWVKVFVYIMDP
jgi:hypothetical protein